MPSLTWSTLKAYFFFLALALAFYFDGFSHFFYQDDLFHFWISRAKSLSDVAAWFHPVNEFGYQIYRPLGTQVVFGLMQTWFGLDHTPFHWLILGLLSLNTTLIYRLLRRRLQRVSAVLLSIFYLFHHQNIGVVYFLSTVQLTLALTWTLISLHLLERQRPGWQWQIWLLYLATLLSQEIALLNAVIWPVLLYARSPQLVRAHWRWVLLLLGTMLAYLAMRFYFINQQIFSDNTHYLISLHPASLLNNLAWYGLWFLSVPEYAVNFVGAGLRPLPPLFGQYARETWLSLGVLLTSVLAIGSLVYRQLQPKFWQHSWYLLAFGLSLAPVLVFPWHKYVYHLPIASVFLLLWLATLLPTTPPATTRQQLFNYLALSVLIMGAISTNFIDRRHSYNYQRGALSAQMKAQVDWAVLASGPQRILVKNDPSFQVFSADWGNTSTQAKVILKEDLFFKLLSGNEQLEVFYEDDLSEAERAEMSFELEVVAESEVDP